MTTVPTITTEQANNAAQALFDLLGIAQLYPDLQELSNRLEHAQSLAALASATEGPEWRGELLRGALVSVLLGVDA